MPRVLIAEDDDAVRNSLDAALTLEGHQTILAADGQQALKAALEQNPDLAIMDVMMPHLTGTEVTKKIRESGSRLPILILTAREETSDRVAGLDAGADDYMTKPYELEELKARLRALLRRQDSVQQDIISAGPVRVDLAGRKAWIGARELSLTKTEYDLLELLVRNQGVVMSRDSIYQAIWDYDFGPQSKNLTVYINYLRGKLEEEGEERVLETVRGVGYVIR